MRSAKPFPLFRPAPTPSWVACAGLFALSLLIGLERFHTYQEPMERDISTYAVVAQGLLSGRSLYSDLWDHKPPAIHFIYAMAEAVGGYGAFSIYLLNVLAAVATLFGVYRAGSAIGGKVGGLWAGAFWALISGDLYLEANQPNTEVFLNACLIWAFALWLEKKSQSFNSGHALKLGTLFTLASFFKQTALLVPLFLFGASFLFGRKEGRKILGSYTAFCFGIVGVAWVLLFFSFWLRGSFPDFYGAVFTYNLFIQGGLFPRLVQLVFSALWPSALVFAIPLVAGAAAGFVLGIKESPRLWVLWAAFAAATEFEIISPGNFFHHYYQLWLPVLAVGGAWGAVEIGERLAPYRKILKQGPALILLALLAAKEIPYYRMPPNQWSRGKYGDIFIEDGRTARFIKTLLAPGETFYEWGNETDLYFLTGCRPPSGVFYAYPLTQGPLREKLTQRTLAQLENEKPELFVFNGSFFGPGADNPAILSWFKQRYEKIPGNAVLGPYLFLARRGGQLEKRLKKLRIYSKISNLPQRRFAPHRGTV
jgi:4-amino-4-deoxy-L-arabinose transferase-like glycosyltransferase